MVKKLQKLSADKKKSNAQLSSTVKDSARCLKPWSRKA